MAGLAHPLGKRISGDCHLKKVEYELTECPCDAMLGSSIDIDKPKRILQGVTWCGSAVCNPLMVAYRTPLKVLINAGLVLRWTVEIVLIRGPERFSIWPGGSCYARHHIAVRT